MTKLFTDIDLSLHDLTPVQLETLLGGYCQFEERVPHASIISIKKGVNKVETKIKGVGSDNYSNKDVNSTDNSKKLYINGLLVEDKD
ncbi:hypothetical protein I8751_23945 [Nostocaceae cyanobacterium CENA357]|uniref:Uncharacterized protein n=1 Tax=Atlanticothrix silvestris CENA357 TaxID=1725252 RepID=A0A8J7HHW2_9CYAN|nr:hypothetical protein [Atlanticothrix silvestris]MBH8555344.1 hypothetical protein [Atlanticothrix silvestris CENA357]